MNKKPVTIYLGLRQTNPKRISFKKMNIRDANLPEYKNTIAYLITEKEMEEMKRFIFEQKGIVTIE